MQADGQHVVAVVENRLGAVAMVEVHIQHGDLAIALVTKGLGHDGSVVEETVAAEQIGVGMVSGWSAQGKGGALAFGHQFLGGQGYIGGCPGGFPGAV